MEVIVNNNKPLHLCIVAFQQFICSLFADFHRHVWGNFELGKNKFVLLFFYLKLRRFRSMLCAGVLCK